jgi:hypothetical protein
MTTAPDFTVWLGMRPVSLFVIVLVSLIVGAALFAWFILWADGGVKADPFSGVRNPLDQRGRAS